MSEEPIFPTPERDGDGWDFPLEHSIGAAVRFTHRSFLQELQVYLEPYAITVGMWFFLRVLYEEDGLTQHELSRRSRSMDATTVEQLRNMERIGLVERRRSEEDRRKIHVYLTARGKSLRGELLHFAQDVNQAALAGLSDGEVGFLRLVLARIRSNLDARRRDREQIREAAAQPAKRPRGRPRRNAQPPAAANGVPPAATEAAPRRRGRPRRTVSASDGGNGPLPDKVQGREGS